MANISLRVLSRPLEPELPRIYQELGTDFDDRVLPSLGNEVRMWMCYEFLYIGTVTHSEPGKAFFVNSRLHLLNKT